MRVYRLIAFSVQVFFLLVATTANAASSNKNPKRDICHYDADTRLFHVINISTNAVSQHFANHGDGYPSVFYADIDGDGLGDALGDLSACPNPGFVDNSLDACPVQAANTPNGCPVSTVRLGSDLVTGNGTPGWNQNNLSILTGNGAGGFSINNYSTGQWRNHTVAVGDFNKNGKDDIVLVHYDGQVWVDYDGVGDGVSLAYVATVTGNPFQGVAAGYPVVADFNGDGWQDLVVKSFTNISVFLNNQSGGFGTENKFPSAGEPRSLAVADLDGDGFLDIVAVGEAGSGGIALHYGDGSGTSFTRITIGGGDNPSANVKIADIDGDGDLDVITGNWGSKILFYLNNGARSYTLATLNAAPGLNKLMLASDLNGDGAVDLVTSASGSSSIEIWFNDGTGSFPVAPDSYAVGASPVSAVLGDFNEDGKADIATVNLGSNNISILLGQGNGIFGTATNIGPLPAAPESIAVGDFD